VLKAVYDRHIAPFKSFLPETDLEALNMACSRPKYAAIDLRGVLSYYSNKVACDLEEVSNAYVEYKESMIIQKRSPYLRLFKRM
jgi:hypothetical protein